MIGQILGNYRIKAAIGKGGMAQVYLAEHEVIGAKVAVKVLLPSFIGNKAMIQRFLTEAHATAAVRHPGIIEINDFGRLPNGGAYMIMEYLQGETLHRRMRREKRLSLDQALNFTRQIAAGLSAAHRTGIIHRDLKPDNIFIVADDEVYSGERTKILDFGIAKLSMNGFGGNRGTTKTGVIIGTPDYMPPEQCKGLRDIDHRADLYSVGCILFKMLTGRTPFAEYATGEVISCHVLKDPPPPESLIPNIPPDVSALILELLEKNPADRLSSADELLSVLERLGSTSGHHASGRRASSLGLPRPGSALGSMSGTTPGRVSGSMPETAPIGFPGTAITRLGHGSASRPPTLPVSFAPDGFPGAPEDHRTASLPPAGPPDTADSHRTYTPVSTLSGAAKYHTVAIPDLPPPRRSSAARYGVIAVLAVLLFGGATFSTFHFLSAEDTPVATAESELIKPAARFPEARSDQPVAAKSTETTPDRPSERSPETPAEKPTITIDITSTPLGAEVFQMPQGVRLGKTPLELPFENLDGEYVFQLRRAGYIDHQLEADARKSAGYHVDLEKRAPAVSKASDRERPGKKRRKNKRRKAKVKDPQAEQKSYDDVDLMPLD